MAEITRLSRHTAPPDARPAVLPPPRGFEAQPSRPPPPGGHDFSRISVHAPQSKPTDSAVADGVMRAEDPDAAAGENQTGLPDGLKSGMEQLAGLSLDDVRVHYGSPHTDGLVARAFTQGSDIHVGAGEQRHLGHEAWHVVQQKQGRVRPMREAAGLPINDDAALEAEADSMGGRFGGTADVTPRAGAAPSAGPGTAAPIQRMPKRPAFDKKAASHPGQAAAIVGIGDAIDNYHAIKPKADKDYQLRLQALAEIDRRLYAWFDAQVTDTIDATPNGPHMKKMLEESASEHRKLVAKIAKKSNLVPIDTRGMQQGEVDSVRQTWRGIVEGTGNLKIKGGIGQGDFKDRQQANIAKLLQHPAGRQIVAGVNAPQGDKSKNVTIGSNFKSELKKFGRKDPKESQAVPKTPNGDVTSMGFQKVNRNELGPDDHPVVYPGGRADGPQRFNRFINALPQGTTHFEYEGQVYKTGQGVGSYVKMAGKGGVGANVGTRMQETVVPEFVTLGHELSHSERQMKGTAVPFGMKLEKLGFHGNDMKKKLWNNAEEYVAIAGAENSIRHEHGISGRQFHAGDLAEAKVPIQRGRLENLILNPLASPKGQPALPGYKELFDIYAKLALEPSEDVKKRVLMDPTLTQQMDTLEHHINLAQQNAPVNNPPVNNVPVNNAQVNAVPV